MSNYVINWLNKRVPAAHWHVLNNHRLVEDVCFAASSASRNRRRKRRGRVNEYLIFVRQVKINYASHSRVRNFSFWRSLRQAAGICDWRNFTRLLWETNEQSRFDSTLLLIKLMSFCGLLVLISTLHFSPSCLSEQKQQRSLESKNRLSLSPSSVGTFTCFSCGSCLLT